MAETSIQWTSGPNGEEGYTFNPWLGCAKDHTGCTHCYAEKAQPVVMRKGGAVQWGEVWQGGQRAVVADSTWKKPHQWAREAAKVGQRRKVFCASLADVLEVPEPPKTWPREWTALQRADALVRVSDAAGAVARARDRLWDTIRDSASECGLPNCGACVASDCHRDDGGLDWLLLTKRPENWRLVPEDVRPLVWLGTSISDQKTADEWAPRLLDADPAGFRVRFLSIEPLTGPVDLSRWMPGRRYYSARCKRCGHIATSEQFIELRGMDDADVACPKCDYLAQDDLGRIDWVIVGGESGPKARPCNVAWVRDIVRQCREAGVPCFVKQLGSHPSRGVIVESTNPRTKPGSQDVLHLRDGKGGDMSEWPEDLRVRQFPEVRP